MDGAILSQAFTAHDLRRRLKRDRNPDEPSEFGDHHFNPQHPRLQRQTSLRDAAVLIPVVDHPQDASIILTKRAETLRNHTGQIAFPGGRIDAGDVSPEAAALRETFEEIGLASDRIEVIGRMPDYVSGSGYRIAPVFGVVRPGYELTVNGDEVDAVFEVPLRFLMDEANHKRDSRVWNGLEWYFYDMPYQDRRIWGVTAGIIRTMYERLYR